MYALPKVNKEKRERQPNWTEAEKQLLLSLTQKHQNILENKGSDTMTIKRKSEAWDSIASNMNAAGYNRSKDRLKQQLGRIKAAEAKKLRGSLEQNLIAANTNGSATSGEPCDEMQPVNLCIPTMDINKFESTVESTAPIFLQDNPIKMTTESTPINQLKDDGDLLMQEGQLPLPISSIADKPLELDTTAAQQMLTDVPPIPGTVDMKDMSSLDSTSSSSTPPLDATTTTTTKKTVNIRYITSLRRNLPRTRKQRLQRLHMYRLAVERERLRALKMQQKRDRILYRKDIQIQNLKLQILRNLTNHSLDNNHINF